MSVEFEEVFGVDEEGNIQVNAGFGASVAVELLVEKANALTIKKDKSIPVKEVILQAAVVSISEIEQTVSKFTALIDALKVETDKSEKAK